MKELMIANAKIAAGENLRVDIPIANLYTGTPLSMSVHVYRAAQSGPMLFVSAAIHGDEINGIEIIRRLLALDLPLFKGTLIAVPMVNVYGVLNQSRYLPDRRDLNRCFPGKEQGALAEKLAHIFMTQIVQPCDYGIDLHTGAIHRENFPQIRGDLQDVETLRLAQAFGAPLLINSAFRKGSLRQSALENSTPVLVYEAGEALRFNEFSIQVGVNGIQNVLQHLGMLQQSKPSKLDRESIIANQSEWLRASGSGFVHELITLGGYMNKKQTVAEIYSPAGDLVSKVVATRSGIVIGKQNIPLVQEGDAMFHVAYFNGKEKEFEYL